MSSDILSSGLPELLETDEPTEEHPANNNDIAIRVRIEWFFIFFEL
jgi:hypothetical protein